MSTRLVIRPLARADLFNAHDWCERQQAGLGERFKAAIDRALEAIADAPKSRPIVYRDVRRAIARPFPYGIYYCVESQEICVIAVMHGHRNPSVIKLRRKS